MFQKAIDEGDVFFIEVLLWLERVQNKHMLPRLKYFKMFNENFLHRRTLLALKVMTKLPLGCYLKRIVRFSRLSVDKYVVMEVETFGIKEIV
jgi:hypothetical protein